MIGATGIGSGQMPMMRAAGRWEGLEQTDLPQGWVGQPAPGRVGQVVCSATLGLADELVGHPPRGRVGQAAGYARGQTPGQVRGRGGRPARGWVGQTTGCACGQTSGEGRGRVRTRHSGRLGRPPALSLSRRKRVGHLALLAMLEHGPQARASGSALAHAYASLRPKLHDLDR